MYILNILGIFLLSSFSISGYTNQHISSYPFIAGDTFRQFCDFVVDGYEVFDPEKVKSAQTIYVEADHLERFFAQLHPLIQHPYIIVSHNTGYAADNPIPGVFHPHLDDPKIIAWFAKNVDRAHAKLHPLPIGLANQFWPHGNIGIFSLCIKNKNKHTRNKLLYMNFSRGTYPTEREYVYNLFSQKPFCTIVPSKDMSSYLEDFASHKFTLSPRGNGLDCHRTWEALLMGCYPIVKHSTLDPLFEGLPVLIVNSWDEVTEEFLNKKYAEMSEQTYHWEKIYAQYWLDQIRACQAHFLNH